MCCKTINRWLYNGKYPEQFRHWKLDSMVSSRGKSKGCFSTFVERKLRLYVAWRGPDRTADSMESAIIRLYAALPKGTFKTATTDRGKEFACYQAVEKRFHIPVYFILFGSEAAMKISTALKYT